MWSRPTFDVPGTPYSVAESNLVVLDHVKVPEVFPLRLNQHATVEHTHTQTHINTRLEDS